MCSLGQTRVSCFRKRKEGSEERVEILARFPYPNPTGNPDLKYQKEGNSGSRLPDYPVCVLQGDFKIR